MTALALIVMLALSCTVTSAVEAQQPTKVYRIGVLSSWSLTTDA